MMPSASDLRYNWVLVRLQRIDATECRELVSTAWAMVVPSAWPPRTANEHQLYRRSDALRHHELVRVGTDERLAPVLREREAITVSSDEKARYHDAADPELHLAPHESLGGAGQAQRKRSHCLDRHHRGLTSAPRPARLRLPRPRRRRRGAARE